eukprot:TRINITY_DN1208_c0_g1_i3.p1 TRINITY_DN1208_c0_g1~~TRINITY_DN1208_c0_g1_i3.p1  ORF type:complete len:139 (-),score=7.71 TRINITY_DN1208_c0_g1_i3:70-486(-)
MNSNKRGDLIGSPRSNGTRAWGRSAPVEETDETRDLDDHSVLPMQRNKIEDQDRVLDILGGSIHKIKEIAISIGNETDEQTELLSDIDERTDRSNAKIKNATKHVEKVGAKSSTKAMWAVICFLLLGLIAVIVCAAYL